MMPNPMMGGMNPMAMSKQIMQNIQMLKSNPMAFIQKRFDLPENVPINDPNAIVNYLVKSGQVSQEDVNNAYRAMQRFR